MKTRFVVIFTLVILTAVFSASALTANMNGPIGQQAGTFAATIFSMFGGDKASPQDSDKAKTDVQGGILISPTDEQRAAAAAVHAPAVVYSNPAPMTIGAAAGPASLYPSDITVAAFPGNVQKVTVDLNGFDHTWPDDVDVMLVGPGGQTAVLMSDMGTLDDVTGLNFTFDDAAAAPLPDTATLTSGTYQPGNIGAGDAFAAPAPASGGSSLGVFTGTDPNGTWSLYVMDDTGGDAGNLVGGWSINITQAIAGTACVAPPANMTAWYPGQVNTNDIIGDPVNNGAAVGTLLYTTGVVGNAFDFSVGASGVQVPPSAGINVGAAAGMSADAWINPGAIGANETIIEWSGTPIPVNGVRFVQTSGGNLRLDVVDSTGASHVTTTTGPVLTAAAWQHVAFTFNKTTGDVALYVNGVAQTLTVANLGTGFTPATNNGLIIGRRNSGGQDFDGLADEVEIFSRALTGAEVSSIFNAGAFGKCHVSQLQFDTDAQSVNEGAGTATVTVKRVGANDSTATANVSTADVTATQPADYGTASVSTVTFSPGERTQTYTVPIVDDAIDENDETFTTSLSMPTGNGVSLGAPILQTITILDNDAVPNMTIDSQMGVEGTPPGAGGSATFTVTKTGATVFPTSVVVTPTNGTATGGAACAAGVDFINTATTLNFPASLTTDTQNVTVNFCPDSDVEGDEGFTMVLTPGTGAPTVGAAGAGTIQDDDSSVQFTAATFANAEGTIAGPGLTPFALTISRTGTGSALPAAAVDASTIQVGGSANGENSCAIAGADYVVVSGQTITWGAGDVANKSLIVQVCADSRDEANEIFNSQLSNANGTQIGAQASAVTTITDDDAAPSFALTPVSNTVNEGASATYTVTRSGNETQLSTTVSWAATNGTAVAPGDYSGTSGNVTFAPGTGGTQTFTIAAINDNLFEGLPNETFTVNLTAASNGSPFSGTTTTSIVDVNTAPTVAIDDVAQVELDSGQSAFIFTITRTGNAQANQTMKAATADGGGPTAATAPSDYTAITGDTVTFTQGQTSRQVAVIVNGDAIFEDDENFTVNLSMFNFGSATDAQGLGTILNDDAAPVFTIGGNVAVTEGDTGTVNATFTINKAGLTELNSIVSANTVDGTAVASGSAATGGNDYVAIVNAQVATFAPGDTVKTFNVAVNGDTVQEGNDAFTVDLTNVTNGTFGTPISATGTINNDDDAPNFAIVSNILTPTEGSPATFTINRSFPNNTTGTVLSSTVNCVPGITSANSTIHAQSNDFSSGSQSISFASTDTTKPCSVNTTQDSTFEGPETFTVGITAGTNVNAVSGGPFTATIVNDDACAFAIGNVSLPEGNAGTSNFVHNVTKTCNTGSFVGFVNYAGTDGTATFPSDYTEIIPGQIAFQPADTAKPLPVSVNGDLLVELDETYNVNLTSATVNGVTVPTGACGVAVCGISSGVGTILNDDGVPISISGTITNFSPAGPLAGVTVGLSGSATASTTTNAAGAYSFANLPSGGNYLVTPVAPAGKVMSPTTRTYTGLTSFVNNANFVAYDTGNIPRTLTAANAYATPGSPVTQNIVLTAQGDEAALTFSLTYNSAILSAPVVACGSGSAGCNLTANTGTPGVIGVSVEAQDGGGFPTTYAAGTRVVVTVTYNTAPTAASNTPVNFADSPTLRRTSDSDSNPLPTVYNNGFIVFAQGLEADVAARNTGDGSVLPADVVQVRRFTAGLDVPSANFNEFQRADSAPSATKGDGLLGANDVVQARRYSAALDPTQTVGGPFLSVAPAPAPERAENGAKRGAKSPEAVGRTIRITNGTAACGANTVVVFAELDSDGGNEAAVQTSVSFDNTKLSISGISTGGGTNPDVVLGPDAPAGSALTVNGNNASAGQIGFLVDSSNTFANLPNRKFVQLTFHILPAYTAGTTPLTLGGTPTPQSISDASANSLTFTNENGLVSKCPTAAGVMVSGRVTTASGSGLRGASVIITDGNGVQRTATTSTFGYYQFDDIAAGETYVIGVTSRRYRFAPRTLQVLDTMADVDFVGQE
ncbi:MAG: Calx-beta domain-containing protein [Pyrinomonadaceae bacterium]